MTLDVILFLIFIGLCYVAAFVLALRREDVRQEVQEDIEEFGDRVEEFLRDCSKTDAQIAEMTKGQILRLQRRCEELLRFSERMSYELRLKVRQTLVRIDRLFWDG